MLGERERLGGGGGGGGEGRDRVGSGRSKYKPVKVNKNKEYVDGSFGWHLSAVMDIRNADCVLYGSEQDGIIVLSPFLEGSPSRGHG